MYARRDLRTKYGILRCFDGYTKKIAKYQITDENFNILSKEKQLKWVRIND